MSAAAFVRDCRLHLSKTRQLNQRVFTDSVTEAYRSITVGSEITAAPGQPVQTGALLRSWVTDQQGDAHATISTGSPYAQQIEDGYRHGYGALTLRSLVGGWHSVKLTRAGWHRIVDYVLNRVRRP